MLYQLERRAYIEKKLLDEGKIRASELADFFDVSPETIRKDLLYLEKKGIAKKEYGGAVAVNIRMGLGYADKIIAHQDEKERIAKAVIDLVRDDMILLLDAGTTVYTVAKMLGIRSNLSVFTNAPRTALLLDDYDIKTHVLGGGLRANSSVLVGEWTVRSINEIHVDAAIISTGGFMEGEGPSAENPQEVEVKRAMMRSSNKVIVAGDSSKAFADGPIQYCRWEDVDTFITDDGLPDKMKRELGKQTHLMIV